jgi:putative ABC transport system permease protein
MHDILQELRVAVRGFSRNRALTAVCVVTLALGIGANTAVYSVIHSVLLKPLPYPEPDRLVRLYQIFGKTPDEPTYVTAPDFVDFREQLESFETLACLYTYRETGFDLTGRDQPERVVALRVSAGFFEVYRTAPMLGRTFSRDEERADARNIIISYDLWQRHFGGDPGCLGQSLTLDGEAYAVVGVMPEGFRDAIAGEVDLWIPQNLELTGSNHRNNFFLTVVGRLESGTSLREARAELDLVARRLTEQFRKTEVLAALVPLHEDQVGRARQMLYILFAAVGLVLLIACVNVANLFMARAAARQQEMAIRSALGSSRAAIIRQLLVESVTLAVFGGLAGVLVAWWGVRALVALQPEGLSRTGDITFDAGLLAFSGAITLLTALLFGLLPAWRSSNPAPATALREAGRGSDIGHGRQRARGILVASQVALAVVLLIGAGLLSQSFCRLLHVEMGFTPENVSTFVVHLPDSRYGEPHDRIRFYEDFRARVEAIPGVSAVGAISKLPASGRYHMWGFQIDGRESVNEDEEWPMANIRCVDGNYFEAMQIPLRRGRLFDERDHAGGPLVVLISESVAARYWADDDDPLGDRILFGEEPRTIVGIVQDTRHDLRDAASRKVYVPHDQFTDNRNWNLTQVVRTESNRADLIPLIREQLSQLDANLILYKPRPLDDIVAAGIAHNRFAMTMMVIFAGMALLLAAVGVYGVLSYFVSQRTHEIGIRMALGAQRYQVRAMVVRQGLKLALIGISGGLAVSFAASRWLSSLVFEISVVDPWTYAGVSLGLLGLAWLAGFVPARRAVRIDPLRALRYE